jgi:hypothetical protein
MLPVHSSEELDNSKVGMWYVRNFIHVNRDLRQAQVVVL